ncbi:hypothetical protein LEP1GSC133_4137 [Leptospira borgpetersenii serovar Pomona str. 200901868]|uniref:Uncharacterized protein n=1 Tax=Leptospira borgpetersenii serovar Pomona str. 200901868 TaxID=1192866 RepID=M6W003_LEPBO|nr:hypothetical protein LEP1GSC133_4137 [Leptospira borgpetersenii serovar Pomona str. 200901868]
MTRRNRRIRFRNRNGHRTKRRWKEKKPEDSFEYSGLQSRTAIYNGNYKSILDIVFSGFFLTLPTEMKTFSQKYGYFSNWRTVCGFILA